MTRYTLPAILGGQDLDGEAHGDGVILDVPGYGNLLMPAHYVTEVEPPLPAEPPNGSVYSNGADVWIRCDDADDSDGVKGDWWTDGIPDPEPWSYVAAIIAGPGWRRYIPDPADAAPTLPFELRDRESMAAFRVDVAPGVRRDPSGWVHAGDGTVELSAPELEQAAAAMLLVARMCREAKR